MRSRIKALATSLLLLLAAGAGGWKILDLSAANRELDRQNRAYAQSVAGMNEALRALRESALKRGSPAAGFTLLGLDSRPVRLDPRAESRIVHLLFIDPAEGGFEDLLRNYRETFGRAEPHARTLVLARLGYEEVLRAVAERGVPYPIAVHASEVYRTYGFLDGPGIAVIEDGRMREKWRLPFRYDQLPIE